MTDAQPKPSATLNLPTATQLSNQWALHRGRVTGETDLSHFHAEFDRWLAEHDAQVAAQTLREAADAVEVIDPGWDSALCIDRVYHPVPEWLRARADRIAAGGES